MASAAFDRHPPTDRRTSSSTLAFRIRFSSVRRNACGESEGTPAVFSGALRTVRDRCQSTTSTPRRRAPSSSAPPSIATSNAASQSAASNAWPAPTVGCSGRCRCPASAAGCARAAAPGERRTSHGAAGTHAVTPVLPTDNALVYTRLEQTPGSANGDPGGVLLLADFGLNPRIQLIDDQLPYRSETKLEVHNVGATPQAFLTLEGVVAPSNSGPRFFNPMIPAGRLRRLSVTPPHGRPGMGREHAGRARRRLRQGDEQLPVHHQPRRQHGADDRGSEHRPVPQHVRRARRALRGQRGGHRPEPRRQSDRLRMEGCRPGRRPVQEPAGFVRRQVLVGRQPHRTRLRAGRGDAPTGAAASAARRTRAVPHT